MAEQNVITLRLDDFVQEQPIQTAICIGQDLTQVKFNQSVQWQYFTVSDFLNLPFQQRYDLAIVRLDTQETCALNDQVTAQLLVKLRDLFARRLLVVSGHQNAKLLRSLGLTQLLDQGTPTADCSLWQFNILTYKHVPDWFNSKFWANPENWDKFRW